MLRAVSTGAARASRGARGWGWFHRELARRSGAAPELPAFPEPEDGSARPQAFFDLSVAGEPHGRVVFELAADLLPVTADNFARLCSGDNEAGLCYRGTVFHHLRRGFVLNGGDVEAPFDGSKSHSALGTRFFDDEMHVIKHDRAGVLSMVNSGAHRNGSQFFVTLAPAEHLDGRNVAFGRVVEGMDLLHALEGNTVQKHGVPLHEIKVEDCGVLG